MQTAPPPDFKFLTRHPSHLLSLGLGVGLIPIAPGTWGSVLGLIIYLLIAQWHVMAHLVLLAILTVIAVWSAGFTAKQLGKHDHRSIVIDEVVGMLFALLWCPLGWLWVLVCFLLFRVFDILKPYPICYIDKNISGGWGIVLDDIAAGVYTFIVIQIIAFFIL